MSDMMMDNYLDSEFCGLVECQSCGKDVSEDEIIDILKKKGNGPMEHDLFCPECYEEKMKEEEEEEKEE